MINRNKNSVKRKTRQVDTAFDYIIYTDGSADNINEPHYGASAYVVLDRKGEAIMYEGVEGYKNVTNNQMELNAIIEAINHVPDFTHCLIRTDSQYCIDVLDHTSKWFSKNMVYINEFRDLVETKGLTYKIEFVKAHADVRWNEYVDRKAGLKLATITGRISSLPRFSTLDIKKVKNPSTTEMVDAACKIASRYLNTEVLPIFRKELIDSIQ